MTGFGIEQKPQLQVCCCGQKLPKVQYGKCPVENVYKEKVWFIECMCWTVWIWSWPEVWRKSHILELGR